MLSFQNKAVFSSHHRLLFLLISMLFSISACDDLDIDGDDDLDRGQRPNINVAQTPAISPAGGTFVERTEVAISTGTPDATIFYTLDGTTPTMDSLEYASPFVLTENSQVRAIATRNGYKNSEVGEADFIINLDNTAPEFLPIDNLTVGAGSTIRFTAQATDIDGDIPLLSTNTIPQGSQFIINGNGSATFEWLTQIDDIGEYTVTFIATDALDPTLSVSIDVQVTITNAAPTNVVATPTISPNGGEFLGPASVTLGTSTAGARIYYTLDGTAPNSSSNLYNGQSLTINASAQLQTVAILSGFTDSAIAAADFVINDLPTNTAVAPTFNPMGGTFEGSVTVTLSTPTPNATIYYTTNGTTPSINSAQYLAPIEISQDTDLQAFAVSERFLDSPVTSAEYIITDVNQPPVLTVIGDQSVSVGDTITFSVTATDVNGDIPNLTLSGDVLPPTAVFTDRDDGSATFEWVTQESDLGSYSLIVTATDGADPEISTTSAPFTLSISSEEAVTAPVISPPGGSFPEPVDVTITSEVVGAAIYYTNDGTQPTTASTPYTEPFTVSVSQTILAISVLDGRPDGTSAPAEFIIGGDDLPFIAPLGPQTVQVGTPLNLSFGSTANNLPTHRFTLSGEGFPALDALTDNANGTASFSWTPQLEHVGTYSVTVTVTDEIDSASTNSITFTITVQEEAVETLAVPIFDPNGGDFTDSITVTLSSATESASIYYTTNGDIPNIGDTLSSGPIPITENTRIYAFAVLDGFNSSASVFVDFFNTDTPDPVVATPVISPNGGPIDGSTLISISSTAGATIFYTTDGTDPVQGESLEYTAPFSLTDVSSPQIFIRAIATFPGYTNSEIGSAEFTTTLSSNFPPINAVADQYVQAGDLIRLTFGTAFGTSQGETNFDTHGFEVAPNSGLPEGVFQDHGNGSATLNWLTTINDIGSYDVTITVVDHLAPSQLNSISFIIDISEDAVPTLSTPTFTLDGAPLTGATANFTGSANISINSAESATIHYTLDGSHPTIEDPEYNGNPIPLTQSTQIQAFAVLPEFKTSNVAVIDVINTEEPLRPVETPIIRFDGFDSVDIFTDTTGATIYYTLDGTAPSSNATQYSAGERVLLTEANPYIRAFAVKDSYHDSQEAIPFDLNDVTGDPRAPTPNISPPNGTSFINSIEVTIALPTPNPETAIYYTIDGTEPSEESLTSTLYQGPFVLLEESTTVRAVSVQDGYSNSLLESATFTKEGDAPALTPSGSQFEQATVGNLFTYTVQATSANPADLFAAEKPELATFDDHNDGTGTFEWTPTADDIGEVSVTFFATDTTNPLLISEPLVLTITVSASESPLVPEAPEIRVNGVGEPVTGTFSFSGAPPRIVLTSPTAGAEFYYLYTDEDLVDENGVIHPDARNFSDSDGDGVLDNELTMGENGNVFQAIAVLDDGNGNVLVSETTRIVFTQEEIGPEIELSDDFTSEPNSEGLFNFNISLNNVTAPVTLRLGESTPIGVRLIPNDNGTYTFDWSTDGVDPGTYNIEIKIVDAESNQLLSTETIILTISDPDIALQCGEEIRIMPLGNSHTQGLPNGPDPDSGESNPARASYRPYLYRSLTGSGYNVNFVGNRNHATNVGFSYDSNHQGYSGKDTAFFRSRMSGYLNSNRADIVLIHIGSNDFLVYDENDPQIDINTALNNVEAILDSIDAHNPDTIVVLAQIINFITKDDGFDATVTEFNRNVKALAEARVNDQIIVVDMEAAVGFGDFLRQETEPTSFDSNYKYAHLTNPGYEKMANVWYQGLQQVLPECGPTTELLRVASKPSVMYSNIDTLKLGNTLIRTPNITGYPEPEFELVNAPQGMIINPETGTFHWHPTTSGTFTVSIKASNSQGDNTTEFTVTVQ